MKVVFLASILVATASHASISRFSNLGVDIDPEKSIQGPTVSYILTKEVFSKQKPQCWEVHKRFNETYFDQRWSLKFGHYGQSLCFEYTDSTFFRFDVFVFAREAAQNEEASIYADKHDHFEHWGATFDFEELAKVNRVAAFLFGDTDAAKYPYGLMKERVRMTLPVNPFPGLREALSFNDDLRLAFGAPDSEIDRVVNKVMSVTTKSKTDIRNLMSTVNTLRYEYKDIYVTKAGNQYTLHPMNLPMEIDRACHKSPGGHCLPQP